MEYKFFLIKFLKKFDNFAEMQNLSSVGNKGEFSHFVS